MLKQTTTALILFAFSALASAQSSARRDHIDVRIIAEHSQVAPGQKTRIAIHFEPDPEWHVYWRNPGDSGLRPEISWQSDSLNIGDLMWAYPESIPVAHMTNYGFHELLLPAWAEVAKNAAGQLQVQAKVEWLVCQEACIPGDAELSLTLPIANEGMSDDGRSALFNSWQEKMPVPLGVLGASGTLENRSLVLDIFANQLVFAEAESVEVFIENLDLVSYQAPQEIKWKRNRLLWKQNLSEYFSGQKPSSVDVVIVVDHKRAYRVNIPIS
jgi:DsbC/DsbD-like thiol-disulfide interchange protein